MIDMASFITTITKAINPDSIFTAVITGVTVGITNYISNRFIVKNLEKMEKKIVEMAAKRNGK